MKYQHRNGTYTVTLKKTRDAKTELYRDGYGTHPASYTVLVNGIEVGDLVGYCKTRIQGNPSGHYFRRRDYKQPNVHGVGPRGDARRELNESAVRAYLSLTSGGTRHPEQASAPRP